MIIPDVNVMLPALVDTLPGADENRRWLEKAIAAPEPVGLTEAVCGAVVRIGSDRRLDPEAPSAAEILDVLSIVRAAEGVVTVGPGPRHWEIFARLCREADARGGLVSDAQHAAVAVEHGATWISRDRDFAKFPSLKWELPSFDR